MSLKHTKRPRLATVVLNKLNFISALCLCLLITGASQPARSQTLESYREQGRIILGVIKSDIKKNYYDPSFKGLDIESKFQAASEKIKQATSVNEVLALIAQVLIEFDDSHTFFIPPRRVSRVEHGWQVQMIGNGCYVAAVQPGSDAEAKGLRPGDRVLSLEGNAVRRANLWKLQYIIYVLSPRASIKVEVVKPDKQKLKLEIAGKVYEGKIVTSLQTGMSSDWDNLIRNAQTEARLNSHRYYEMGEDSFIWKMPSFDLTNAQVDELMGKAKKHNSLILDLRGNAGGSEETMLRLIGHLFDRDIKVGELKRRKEVKPLVAKSRGDKAFKGRLVVLVDSDSGSAAELLARVVQLEKRGIVIGDRTDGSVMRSKHYDHQLGASLMLLYGVSITDGDIIMSDGRSLERVGVKPDELILPSPEDLSAQHDPVLSRAAALVGLNIAPEKAGTLFPVRWKK